MFTSSSRRNLRRGNRRSASRSIAGTPEPSAAAAAAASTATATANTSAAPAPHSTFSSRATSPRAFSSVSEARAIYSTPTSDSVLPTTSDGTQILVQSDDHSVFHLSPLPQDIQARLSSADLYRDSFQAVLDPETRHALFVSRDICYVWRVDPSQPSPTVYTFQVPKTTGLALTAAMLSPLPFAALIHHRPSRDPGLIVVSPDGHVRLWEALAMAVSRAESYHSLTLYLEQEEAITDLITLQPDLYLLATSRSRLFRLSITSSSGRLSMLSAPLTRTRTHWFSLGDGRDPSSSICALTPAPPQKGIPSREVYALTSKSVQRWRIAPNGGEQLLLEHKVKDDLAQHLCSNDPSLAINQVESSLTLLSASALNANELVILISFSVHARERSTGFDHMHAVFQLTFPDTLSPPLITVSRILNRRTNPDPRPLSTPKLVLPHGSPTLFVVFPDAVVLTSITIDSEFEESVPLRDPVQNRFLGASLLDKKLISSSKNVASAISAISATSGILSIEINKTKSLKPVTSIVDKNAENTARLKAKIEQAVFYGDRAENPLAFDLQGSFDGDLDLATCRTSHEIIASNSIHMPRILDLRVQLSDRLAKLKGLINFVTSNGLLGRLSQEARRTLASHAEKVAAAIVLWHHQNSLMGTEETVLERAIALLLRAHGEGVPEDYVRTFFRIHLERLEDLFYFIQQVVSQAGDHKATTVQRSSVLLESNRLIIFIYNSTLRYRRETLNLYGIDSNSCSLEPWTSKANTLDILEWNFDSTEKLTQSRVRDVNDNTSTQGDRQAELLRQLTDLGSTLLSMYEERIIYDKGFSTQHDAQTRIEYFHTVRSRVVHDLVKNGRPNHAFELAEKHEDFRSLVELCNDPKIGSKAQMHFFMEKYRDTFADILFQWLIEKGRFYDLLNQDEVYGGLLLRFFEKNKETKLSWLHDIVLGRYSSVSQTLYDNSLSADKLREKQIMLSIGKLANIAQLCKPDLEVEQNVRTLETFDDSLDIVAAQERFTHMLRETLGGVNLRKPIDEQANIITSKIASKIQSRRIFSQLFTRLVKKCLEGTILDSEELIDVFTLKSSRSESSIDDFKHSLEILRRAKDIPSERIQSTLQTIWRRVYIYDDWESLEALSSQSDDARSQALKQTAVYQTIDLAISAGISDKMILKPTETFFMADRTNIVEARFTDYSPVQIEELLKDYAQENEIVKEGIERYGLDDYYNETLRLLTEEDDATQFTTSSRNRQRQQAVQEQPQSQSSMYIDQDTTADQTIVIKEDEDLDGEGYNVVEMDER